MCALHHSGVSRRLRPLILESYASEKTALAVERWAPQEDVEVSRFDQESIDKSFFREFRTEPPELAGLLEVGQSIE